MHANIINFKALPKCFPKYDSWGFLICYSWPPFCINWHQKSFDIIFFRVQSFSYQPRQPRCETGANQQQASGTACGERCQQVQQVRSSRRCAKRIQQRLPHDEQDHCLVAERMARERRYDDVVAEKEALKNTLMDTEQHCLGLMMEAQLRYIEYMDVQDDIKQIVIRARMLEERLAFMRNKWQVAVIACLNTRNRTKN